jgi:hypothetical protein
MLAVEQRNAAQLSSFGVVHWHPMLLHHHPDAEIFLCNDFCHILAVFQLMMLTINAALLTRNAFLRG